MYHVVSLPANPHTYNACVFSCILTLEWSTICGPYILWHWLASCSSDCLCASCHNYLVSNRLLWWLTPRQCQESFGLLAVASRNSCMTAGGSVCLKREAWKEEALDSLPWKDERGPSSIIDIGTVLKATLERILRDRMEHIWAFPSTYLPSWTELNWTEPLSDFVWCSVPEEGKDTDSCMSFSLGIHV